jgi:2-phospho-L-lactate/phosphoenolpyruvate guanylyltransferase
MILIPVKILSNAKQRLSPLLDAAARAELARTMLSDVLHTAAQFGGDDASIVTSDSFAIDLAHEHGFQIIRDDMNLSESDAIAMATEMCVARGVASTLVIPGDIPLIEAEDLRLIYEAAPAIGSVLVPSNDKRGSNAVLRRGADLFPLRFGNDSFMPHLSAAIATNTTCVLLSLPRIGLDIDEPRDLMQLAAAPGDKSSQVLARKFARDARALYAQ